MTTRSPFLVSPPEARDTPWRVVADGERTGGMSVGDARLPPRTAGPPRHVHTNEDEGVYVVAGVLTAEVGTQRFEVTPGSFLFMPRGLPHTFANLGTDEVWGIGVINPSGLERFFAEIAEYVSSLAGPPDEDVMLQINARHGIFPADGPPLI
jgi:mannose-6-phosphate isomerase-like protein (cupin superfamily)